jgi:hypothetical protein
VIADVVIAPTLRLFIASFLSLFLELLLMRWVPAQIRVVAYYGNLMLLSSFLGLGYGVMLARKAWGLHRWFAPLLLLLVLFVSALQGVQFQQGDDEFRLFAAGLRTTTLPILVTFALNTLVFVPLGELIGAYFSQIPPLHAYSWDICVHHHRHAAFWNLFLSLVFAGYRSGAGHDRFLDLLRESIAVHIHVDSFCRHAAGVDYANRRYGDRVSLQFNNRKGISARQFVQAGVRT